ncbi:RNA 2',3'-cyclic phosphodiesterase [Gammaproteobacteria bacterium AH-315-C21]|nr:RNA 2',3'-cyclic phosphodiesterase [Gammaproteobacteria bacterium AH-315-C21]
MLYRSFIALELTEASRNQLAELVDTHQAQDKHSEISWPDIENYHVTLAFLGDQLSSDLDRLAEELSFTTRLNADLQLSANELSYFPYHSRPKSLAIMLELDAALKQIKNYTDQTLRNSGINYDKRKFIPHITLGRIRGRKLPNLIIPPRYIDITLSCASFTLFRSERHSDGAIYTPIFRIPSKLEGLDGFDDTWA